MSATRAACSDGGRGSPNAGQWSECGGNGGVTDDGRRYRIEWTPRGVIKRALFRVATDDRVAILQHIRTIAVRQRGESFCELDDDVGLKDIPSAFLDRMRADGFVPADPEVVA